MRAAFFVAAVFVVTASCSTLLGKGLKKKSLRNVEHRVIRVEKNGQDGYGDEDGGYYDQQREYEEKSYYNNRGYYDGITYNYRYTYHGKYNGHCDNDGFYYKDHNSFVICSNKNAYVQPCAPGSRNSALDYFNYGSVYYYRDFCDVNLVDHGYGADVNYGKGAARGVHYVAGAYHG